MPILGPSNAFSPREWGAAVNYDAWTDLWVPKDGIALHHGGGSDYTAAQPPYSTTKEAALLRSWEAFHLRKGWRGLAYGWGVGQSGAIYRIRGWGIYGAHKGDIDGDGISNNREIVPVIWIASGNHHTMTPEAHESIVNLRRFVEHHAPAAIRLWGHREIQSEFTECPGPNGMTYVKANRDLEADMASPGQKLMVDLAFNLFPDEIKGDPNVWYALDENDPQWDTHFRPALSKGAQNLYRRSKTAQGTHDHDGRYIKNVIVSK